MKILEDKHLCRVGNQLITTTDNIKEMDTWIKHMMVDKVNTQLFLVKLQMYTIISSSLNRRISQ